MLYSKVDHVDLMMSIVCVTQRRNISITWRYLLHLDDI